MPEKVIVAQASENGAAKEKRKKRQATSADLNERRGTKIKFCMTPLRMASTEKRHHPRGCILYRQTGGGVKALRK